MRTDWQRSSPRLLQRCPRERDGKRPVAPLLWADARTLDPVRELDKGVHF